VTLSPQLEAVKEEDDKTTLTNESKDKELIGKNNLASSSKLGLQVKLRYDYKEGDKEQ
jgi:hypothetical protein